MNADALIAELERHYDITDAARDYLAKVEEGEEKERLGACGKMPPDGLWNFLKAEVYELLCLKSAKYQKEREALKHSVAPAVGLLSSLLTKKVGIEAGAATGLAAVALLVPLKLSLNAWCDVAKAEMFMNGADRKALRELGNRKSKAK